jgi:hypothetical protein
VLVADCHSSTSPSGSDSTPPVLSAAIIDLAQLTDFLPFGASLGDHQNPAYELYTGSDTLMVQAASPGSVDVIEANPAPQTDFEIRIRPSAQSIYLLIYDHIVAPQVSVGQTVSAGQTLGQIGPFNDHGRNRNGRVEIQINRGTGADTMAICPRNFGTADFNALHAAAFLRFPGQGIDICIGETVKP